ncbi:E2-like conjugating enzyme atg10 [Metarhizium acridum]|nr:E2-like conjugating enzyme atg10 [Metarhizium acridum]
MEAQSVHSSRPGFSTEGGYTTYIQIVRPLEIPDDLDLHLDGFTISPSSPTIYDIPTADDKMIDDESDEAAIVKPTSQAAETVTYEIHLHPTYRVPCLWFSLHGLPSHEPAFNIDTVFRRLVPDEYKEGLRGLGGIGGISADHHPVTGVPAFFVHPCLLGDAISNFKCSRQDYLMVWLGLVGGCVGLWIPKEMAFQ